MLKAALNKEVSKPVHHQWVCLRDYSVHNGMFLLWSTNLELLLEENGSLLVIVADNFVNYIFPVTIDTSL